MPMSTATDMLTRYLDAETQLLAGGIQVRFGDRQLTRANLPEIIAGRKEWERRVNNEQRLLAGGSSIRYQTADFS